MENSITIPVESWFIPLDILMIIATILGVLFGLLFLLVIITHKKCWSVPILLIFNSSVVEVCFSCVLLIMAIFTLQQDLRMYPPNVSLCIIAGSLSNITFFAQNYSFLLTAVYRYISVVYPNRLLLLSAKFQLCLIISKWIFCILAGLPLPLVGRVIYNIDNQVCQVPLAFTLLNIYLIVLLYSAPNLGVLILYLKLTRYVQQMSMRTTAKQTLFHARRELRLVQRTFILGGVVLLHGLPYATFDVISFFTTPYKYHFRIAFIFVDTSLLSIIILLYYFTQQIRDIVQEMLSKSIKILPIINV